MQIVIEVHILNWLRKLSQSCSQSVSAVNSNQRGACQPTLNAGLVGFLNPTTVGCPAFGTVMFCIETVSNAGQWI